MYAGENIGNHGKITKKQGKTWRNKGKQGRTGENRRKHKNKGVQGKT